MSITYNYELKNIYFIQNLMISLKQATGNRQALINILSESLYVSIFEFTFFLKFSFLFLIQNTQECVQNNHSF